MLRHTVGASADKLRHTNTDRISLRSELPTVGVLFRVLVLYLCTAGANLAKNLDRAAKMGDLLSKSLFLLAKSILPRACGASEEQAMATPSRAALSELRADSSQD